MADDPKFVYIPSNPVHGVYNANELHIHYYPPDPACPHMGTTVGESPVQGQQNPLVQRTHNFVEGMLNDATSLLSADAATHRNSTKLAEALEQSAKDIRSMLKSDTSLAAVAGKCIKVAALAYLVFESIFAN